MTFGHRRWRAIFCCNSRHIGSCLLLFFLRCWHFHMRGLFASSGWHTSYCLSIKWRWKFKIHHRLIESLFTNQWLKFFAELWTWKKQKLDLCNLTSLKDSTASHKSLHWTLQFNFCNRRNQWNLVSNLFREKLSIIAGFVKHRLRLDYIICSTRRMQKTCDLQCVSKAMW